MPAYLVQLPSRGGRNLPEASDTMVVFATDVDNARAMAQGQFDGDANAVWLSEATVTEIVAGTVMSGYDMLVQQIGAAAGSFKKTAKSGETLAIGAVAVNDGGVATYVIDDILTAVGGTFQRAATFRVITVSTGVITAVELVDPGDYSVLPTLAANPVSGGGGTGALLDLTEALAGSWEQLAGHMVSLLNGQASVAGADVDFSEGASGARLFTVSDITDAFGDGTLTVELSSNGTPLPQLVGTITDGGIAGAVLTAAIPASPLAPANVTALKS